jgi:hypothetical protein
MRRSAPPIYWGANAGAVQPSRPGPQRPPAPHVAAALARTGPATGFIQGRFAAPPAGVVQPYSVKSKDSGSWRLSEDEKMAVLQGIGHRGSQSLFLDPSVQKASSVLTQTFEKSLDFSSLYRFRPTFDQLDNDCGSAALKLMKVMNNFSKKMTTRLSTQTQSQELALSNPRDVHDQLLSLNKIGEITNDNAFPQVGQAYLIITAGAEHDRDSSLFNFHWAAVIASSGGEVITAENITGGDTATWWFQLYSQWDWSQTFHRHYAGTGRFGRNPLTLVASLTQVQSTVSKIVEVLDLEEL